MLGILTIHASKISDEDFERIVRANPDWNFEQTAAGELVVVSTEERLGERTEN